MAKSDEEKRMEVANSIINLKETQRLIDMSKDCGDMAIYTHIIRLRYRIDRVLKRLDDIFEDVTA